MTLHWVHLSGESRAAVGTRLMSDHLPPWGSGAAREAVVRTCQEIALQCQRVATMYAAVAIRDENGYSRSGRLDQDELSHVTVHDPDPTADPGTATGYRTCQFEWVDETSPTLSLSWSCTRERGHHGQHLAGTGEWVAAVRAACSHCPT